MWDLEGTRRVRGVWGDGEKSMGWAGRHQVLPEEGEASWQQESLGPEEAAVSLGLASFQGLKLGVQEQV